MDHTDCLGTGFRNWHCPEGSVYPTLCKPGYHIEEGNTKECKPCPPGKYCWPVAEELPANPDSTKSELELE